MSEFFGIPSPYGRYEITVGTNNDFAGGLVRIQPPVHLSADFLESIGGEHNVRLWAPIVGQEATTLSYLMQEESAAGSTEEPTNKTRIKHTMATIAEELGYLTSANYFIENF
jgi:hypothetical protein